MLATARADSIIRDAACPISVTSSAADFLQSVRPGDKHFLRISVMGGGAAGVEYRFAWDRYARDADTLCEIQGVRFVIDAISLKFIRGATVVNYSGALDLHGVDLG
jgi:iron-sulfur cluster insertion protein